MEVVSMSLIFKNKKKQKQKPNKTNEAYDFQSHSYLKSIV